MSDIWGVRSAAGSACTRIPYKGYEISIAMDDSCGAMADYRRSDIAVFKGGEIVTTEFGAASEFKGLPATAETLQVIFAVIDAKEKP